MELESVAATLRAARELIADSSHWTTLAWAKNKEGKALASYNLPNEKDVDSFCAMGAIYRIDGPHEAGAFGHLRKAAAKLFSEGIRIMDPITVNDQLGHEAVLQMFDEAIAEAERSAS